MINAEATMTWRGREVLATAAFSDDRVYRYALGRVWDRESEPIAFIMLNPSKATHTVNDPTITRCMDFATRWGAGGILVVNLFAVRATDPRELSRLADPVGPHNQAFVVRAIEQHRVALTVAAWGSHRLAIEQVTYLLARLGDEKLACLGKNADGSPKHPLYLPKNAMPMPWP